MTYTSPTVTVVGAGLAGCEAAWQLAKRRIPVHLIDMKPVKYSPAHKSPGFAELVCSNSLKAEHLTNASGLLKAELRALDSLIQGELRALSEDPEMRSFVDRTLEALFTLGNQIEQSVAPDVQNAENTENGQEPIESTVEEASP